MMERLLQVGDIFTSQKFADLHGYTCREEGKPPVAQFDRLRVNDHESSTVTFSWTERADGGWTRPAETVLNVSAPDMSTTQWLVQETEFTGGGTGHGPHDTYPDGHRVTATPLGASTPVLYFYQTGCFIGMVRPDDVELIGESGTTETG